MTASKRCNVVSSSYELGGKSSGVVEGESHSPKYFVGVFPKQACKEMQSLW